MSRSKTPGSRPESPSSTSTSPTSPPDPDPTTPETDAPAARVTVPTLRVGRPTQSTTTTEPGPEPGYEPDPIEADTNTPSSDATAVRVDKAPLREIARGLVLAVSGLIHERLATTDEAKAADLWLAGPDDQAQIGDPLAEIAGRHGVPAGAGSPDTADLIAAGIGLIAYLAKHISTAWALRSRRRHLAGLDKITEPEGTPAP